MTKGSVASILRGMKNVTMDISFKVTPLSAFIRLSGMPMRLARRLCISLGLGKVFSFSPVNMGREGSRGDILGLGHSYAEQEGP